MSRWLPSPTRRRAASLGVGPDGLALVWYEANGDVQHTQIAGPAAQALPHLGEWLAAAPALGQHLRRHGLRVTMTEDMTRWWLVHPPSGTASLAELEAFARLRHQEIFGVPLDAFALRAGWAAGAPSVCCVVPVAVSELVSSIGQQFGIRCLEAVPALRRLIGRWPVGQRSEIVVALPQADRAVVLGFGNGTLWRVRQLRVAGEAGAELLAQEIARTALRQARHDAVVVLHGPGGRPSTAPAIDGVKVRQLITRNRPANTAVSSVVAAALLGLDDAEGRPLVDID